MTADLELIREGELTVVGVAGHTDDGVEFVDAYTAEDIVVVDSGRIVLPADEADRLAASARERGLIVTDDD